MPLAALQVAITDRQRGPGLLQQSGRGSQHAAHDDRRLLAGHGMPCSMSRKETAGQRPMEGVFGSSREARCDGTQQTP
ncbi:hypothetical protein ACFQY5_08360 [Paeniroseomonas aquatica]|uniref:Uncharacterized protein n=1 Tax=Paeniroseomonas aquatica TaxID=373043 RepID=A0ABT8A3H8_9PROT|nr:hypothetical protein [Paeniroseomonas aquatica]MDN3563926.1 hypothetical protein [Paeniroseomonas aquatica]